MFDMETVFFFGAMICGVCSLILYSSRRLHSGSADGIQSATIAEACMGGAMLLIALHGVLPAALTGVLSNCLGVTASVFIYDSTRRMIGVGDLGSRLLWWLGAAIAAQCIATLTLSQEGARIAVTSLIQGAFVAACLPLLIKPGSANQPLAVRWGIGFAALYAVAHTARAMVTGVFGNVPGQDLVQNSFFVGASAALIAIAPMIYAMVIIGLVNGRVSEQYRRQAEVDVLTGLHTRRSFFARAHAVLGDPRPEQLTPSVLMLDLDKFKSINDLHGHAWGDHVLREFGGIVRQVCPVNSLIGRIGGEEFCVILSCAQPEVAQAVADKICQGVRAWRGQPGQGPARMSVSGGIAHRPLDGESLEALLEVADRRLYMAKTRGRNQIVSHDIVAAGDTVEVFGEVMPI
ncbi:MAG: GGDEF domain-containing protein [Burkholderiaceae bacterium]